MVKPDRTLAFIFPGQASQRAGMAAELLEHEPVARDLFGAAGEILGIDLANVCTRGSNDLLARTDITQPALLATSAGWLAALRERGVTCSAAAGHSLGEFTAWVAAGSLAFEDAVRLVRRRGELMAEASQRRPGGMLAVIGLRDSQVAELCESARYAGIVVPANFNSPGQVVVSGEAAALGKVEELAAAAGGRTVPLQVSGAFHSPLMDDAAHEFAGLVAEAEIRDPQIPVVANATGERVADAQAVRRAMTAQMSNPVLWITSIKRMVADGVDLFAEVGPGRVLTGLARRITAQARALPVGSSAQLEKLVQEVHS